MPSKKAMPSKKGSTAPGPARSPGEEQALSPEASGWPGAGVILSEEDLELVVGGMPSGAAYSAALTLAEEAHTSLGG
jgi:hypothetical protein